jgi:hypothetical protein
MWDTQFHFVLVCKRVRRNHNLLANPCFRLGQPTSAQLVLWDAGQIRLEIEKGRAVEHVNSADVQGAAVTTQKFDDGESDRVGTTRRARREDAMRTIVGRWGAQQLEPVLDIQTIKDPKHNQVRESLDVGEAEFKLRQDLKNALGIVLRAQTFWDLLPALVGAVYVSDRLAGKYHWVLQENSCISLRN